MSMSRSQSSSGENILLYIIALFFPPIPVGIKSGCGGDLIINICLWIFGWIPGVIHAWYMLSSPWNTERTHRWPGISLQEAPRLRP
ncbi:hypothetical protein BKA70DRAFT_839819 [Coprinopsis sp. MPI-PUGE-AT-0042]|nr:hypothetical protein BKA70DRAFT_839819 [Coprinopsis sp. MPI-PUGE-AT-0042]